MRTESVNVAGLDEIGHLCVFVSNADPELSAVDRALLYEAAPELLAACKDMLAELQSFIVAVEEVYGVETLLTSEQIKKHGATARAEAAIAKAEPE
jgi:hypothetical protein